MLFNSDTFLLFFGAFGLLYYMVRSNLRARNALIVIASYIFYGWWDWRFVPLLAFTSVVDFAAAILIHDSHNQLHRKKWLAMSIIANLGVLGFFKYCGFFVDSIVAGLAQLGIHAEPRTWNLILPVGISFYTFQSMSYTIDVYRRQIPPTKDPLQFLAYVCFFPQLLAGPIERAQNLLPQFAQKRIVTDQKITEGIWLVIWGMFEKVVVADNLAPLVEMVYQDPVDSAPAVMLATVAFALQIFGDFAGYSDIARGLAKILGFELMENFRLPYFAPNPREFWRRWHISLSSWLRDYLYISLGGNKRGRKRTYANLMVTMFLGGLWHGAGWHFVLWGIWHGLGLVAHRFWRERHPALSSGLLIRATAHAAALAFILYGWILFRANSVGDALVLTKALSSLNSPAWLGSYIANLVVYSAPIILMMAWQARTKDMLAPVRIRPWLRALLEGLLLWLIVFNWRRDALPFIYFQF
ncbi:MAG: MBOAT family O-acyltransferase [Verrucomicrobiota bacterium]|nr:MBOAT family O-acyltransferase [Verrucomicrobiota bacterium]